MIYDAAGATRLFHHPAYTVAWIGFPLASTLVILWYTPPLILNAKGMSTFYNPHFYYLPVDDAYYSSPPVVLYFQYYSMSLMIAIYVVFGLLFYTKFYRTSHRVDAVGSNCSSQPTANGWVQ